MLKKFVEKIKAAVLDHKKMRIIGIDYGEPGGDHTAITPVLLGETAKEAGEALKEALITLQAETETAESAIRETTGSLRRDLERISRENTNNWRKMHHLPMRRRRGRQKKRN